MPSAARAWLNPEFISEISVKDGGTIVWMDLTKLGKVSGKELNSFADALSSCLRQRPTHSVGFITCPILLSDRISNNLRSEMRRYEDKFDMKNLMSILISLRMEIPPSSRKTPIVFHSWLVVDDATQNDNVFMSSQLVCDRLEGFGVQTST